MKQRTQGVVPLATQSMEQLDKEGCTYGKLMAKDVTRLNEKLDVSQKDLKELSEENKEDHRAIHARLDKLENGLNEKLDAINTKLTQHEMVKTAGIWIVALIVNAVVGFLFRKGSN